MPHADPEARAAYQRSYRAKHGEHLRSAGRERARHGNAVRRAQGNGAYSSWRGMKERCNRPGSAYFHLYGGRGIRVCERWWTFENFLADMGERPDGKSLDRVDPNGNYEPANCRWATPLEQTHNRRSAR
jgi:hypothetical protein